MAKVDKVKIVACDGKNVGEESAPSKRWFVSESLISGSEKYQSASVCKYAVNVV
jgi:hypothetical protein